MTEAEWMACTDSMPMLEFLSDKASERKVRLCACAYCRRIPGFLESEPDRIGLELTERDVDGLANEKEFDELENDDHDIRWYRRDGWDALWRSREAGVEAELAELLREVFGNPFRTVSLDPTWLTPNVITLASTAYEERVLPSGELDPARLIILADALEEAGCTDPVMQEHLRGPCLHVRGCWVVDALLGKG